MWNLQVSIAYSYGVIRNFNDKKTVYLVCGACNDNESNRQSPVVKAK